MAGGRKAPVWSPTTREWLFMGGDDEIERYVEFAEEMYREVPASVPADTHHLTELLSGASGFAAQSRVQPFWVEHEGRILATVAAVRDDEYDRHWREQMGHLLFFEALPDQEAAVAELWQAARGWLAEHGANAARLSLLPGWRLPLTIDAYDAVPTFSAQVEGDGMIRFSSLLAVEQIRADVSWVMRSENTGVAGTIRERYSAPGVIAGEAIYDSNLSTFTRGSAAVASDRIARSRLAALAIWIAKLGGR